MITLYESILRSTKSGKDVFKPKYVSGWAGQQIWQVDSDMKKWFEICDKNDFLAICKDCFATVRRNRSKLFGIRGQVIIKFNDGNFVIYMSINPETRIVDFNIYFLDKDASKSGEGGIREYINKQYAEITKHPNANICNWVPKEFTSIKGRERILDYIQKNLDAIIKQ
jgi:hypothetical protein